jgi:hypothetical protein
MIKGMIRHRRKAVSVGMEKLKRRMWAKYHENAPSSASIKNMI